MFYSVITPEGQLWYCNAGQEPGLLLQAEGVSALSDGGPPLGLFDDAPYLRGARQLEPGDLLLVYSDGITEAESPSGEMFGGERLRATLASCRGMRADEALEARLERCPFVLGGSPAVRRHHGPCDALPWMNLP